MADQDPAIQLALVIQAIERVREDLSNLTEQQKAYVLAVIFDAHSDAVNARFKPLEKLVYGMVALVLVAVLSAVIAIVVVAPKIGAT